MRTARTRASQYPDEQGKQHADPPARARLPGLRLRGPQPQLGGGSVEYNHGKLDGFYKPRRLCARLLQRSRTCPSSPRRQGVHPVRPLLRLAARADVPQPALQCGRRSRAARRRTAPAGSLGQQLGDDLRPGAGAPGSASRYYASDLPFAALFGKRGVPWIRSSRSSTPTRRPATCRTSPSSIPPFAGEDQGISGDEHPTATSATARRSCRRSFTRSWLAAVPARRDVHQLRRVGRLLRPRGPAVRPRCPPEQQASRQSSASPASGFPEWRSRPYARRGHVSHAPVTTSRS